jgi:hypothetical protein
MFVCATGALIGFKSIGSSGRIAWESRSVLDNEQRQTWYLLSQSIVPRSPVTMLAEARPAMKSRAMIAERMLIGSYELLIERRDENRHAE